MIPYVAISNGLVSSSPASGVQSSVEKGREQWAMNVGGRLMIAKKDKFFQMRVDERFLQRLDDLRRSEPDLPCRTEMARRLIEIVFELAEKSSHFATKNEVSAIVWLEELQEFAKKNSKQSGSQSKGHALLSRRRLGVVQA